MQNRNDRRISGSWWHSRTLSHFDMSFWQQMNVVRCFAQQSSIICHFLCVYIYLYMYLCVVFAILSPLQGQQESKSKSSINGIILPKSKKKIHRDRENSWKYSTRARTDLSYCNNFSFTNTLFSHLYPHSFVDYFWFFGRWWFRGCIYNFVNFMNLLSLNYLSLLACVFPHRMSHFFKITMFMRDVYECSRHFRRHYLTSNAAVWTKYVYTIPAKTTTIIVTFSIQLNFVFWLENGTLSIIFKWNVVFRKNIQWIIEIMEDEIQ